MVSIASPVPGSPAMLETATWRDLMAIRQLEQVCFPKDAWPLWDVIGVLTLPNVVRIKAVLNGKIIGFIAADIRPYQKQAWIATIAVLPEFRRQGIGRALLQNCEGQLEVRSIRLSVRSSNAAAIQMYEAAGYRQSGTWPNYYQDGETALVMEKVR